MRQILIFLFIFITSVALGQKHLIGIQGGLNFTNFTSKEGFANKSTKTGFIGGITYDLMLTKKYVLEIDVLYSQRGVNDQFSIIDDYGQYSGQVETEMNYDYLSFPVKIGYKLGNKLKIIPKIGIVPAAIIKAEITSPTFGGNGGIVTGKETIDHKDYVSKFDFGGIVELGIETDLTKNIIFFSNLNYKHSLTTFSNSDYFNGQDMRHYGFSVAIGLKYLLND
jgi:opacity protein-like surface antigen